MTLELSVSRVSACVTTIAPRLMTSRSVPATGSATPTNARCLGPDVTKGSRSRFYTPAVVTKCQAQEVRHITLGIIPASIPSVLQ